MVVYVGNLMDCIPNRNWKWPQAAHLFADTEEELVEFADRLGLRIGWIQKIAGQLTHFDLTKGMRFQALKRGAIAADRQLEVKYIRAAKGAE